MDLVEDDLDKRAVSREEGEALAKRLGSLYIETSAKTRQGITDAFREVVQKIVQVCQ
jgi:Ras-related protein Rab-18